MTSSRIIDAPQRATLARTVTVRGVGLHSGRPSTAVLSPSSDGIRIVDAGSAHPVSELEVVQTPRCTRLALPSGRHVDMVEHLFAALRISGVTDIDIEIPGDEVPVLDGSAARWVEILDECRSPLYGPVAEAYIVVTPMAFEHGSSRFTAAPGQFSLECEIDFPSSVIGRQSIVLDQDELRTIVSARTFVMEHEIALLKANNLALGGSLDNAIVIGEEGPLNPEGFRMRDECVAHKALDFVGDMMVLGAPVIGRFTAKAPGHAVNNKFLLEMVRCGALRRVQLHPADLSIAA